MLIPHLGPADVSGWPTSVVGLSVSPWVWPMTAGGQAVPGRGGAQARNSVVQARCQGQCRGRCSVSRRAEDAARAGTAINVRRMVAVVALARRPPAMAPAARVRLNAITAQTSQALFAVNFPDGRCATAAFFRSALICSMIA